MLSRRRFLQLLAAWPLTAVCVRPFVPAEPPPAAAAAGLRLALLADAHLAGPDPEQPAAKNFRAALEEIATCQPPVDLVVFLGDLTAAGQPGALALGRDLLTASRRPWAIIPGEADVQGDSGREWRRRFGQERWSFAWQGVQLLGCDLTPASAGGFFLTPDRRDWLLSRLAQLPPDTPALVFTHAPLFRLYRPWGWWTEGSEPVLAVLRQRPRTYLFHGHLHQHLAISGLGLPCVGIPALSWPYPDFRQGPPCAPLPAPMPGRAGCGWLLVTLTATGEPYVTANCWLPQQSAVA